MVRKSDLLHLKLAGQNPVGPHCRIRTGRMTKLFMVTVPSIRFGSWTRLPGYDVGLGVVHVAHRVACWCARLNPARLP